MGGKKPLLVALPSRSPVWLLGRFAFALAALVCLPLCLRARLCGCLALPLVYACRLAFAPARVAAWPFCFCTRCPCDRFGNQSSQSKMIASGMCVTKSIINILLDPCPCSCFMIALPSTTSGCCVMTGLDSGSVTQMDIRMKAWSHKQWIMLYNSPAPMLLTILTRCFASRTGSLHRVVMVELECRLMLSFVVLRPESTIDRLIWDVS